MTHRIRFWLGPWIALLLLAGVPGVGRAQFGNMALRIPHGANTIVLLNAEKILASELAQQENWSDRLDRAYDAGLTILPPNGSQLLMAGQLDFEFMQPIWEMTAVNLNYEPVLSEMAARYGAEVEAFGGRNALALPNDSYVVQLSKQTLATMRPANRQQTSRWLENTARYDGRISDYLKTAIGYADEVGTPLIMAIDLSSVVAPRDVRARLAQFQALAGKNVDEAELARVIASVQGATLAISVKDKIVGALRVDFAEDIRLLGDAAQPALLEVLANQGAMIDDFRDWKVSLTENRLMIQGPLSADGLRRVLSVLSAPPDMRQAVTSASEDEPAPESLARAASQQYFRSIKAMIDDLRGKRGTGSISSLGQVGTWMGNYARKIDNLPILNVDPELLDYGAYVSSAFRQAESELRGAGGKRRVQQLNAPAQYNYAYRWGAYGRYAGYYVEDARAEQQDRTRIATEVNVEATTNTRDIMQQIETATADVRRAMTQKYQVEF